VKKTSTTVLPWFVACTTPIISAIGPIAWWLGSSSHFWFFVPILVFYGVIPILDRVIGDAPSDGHEVDLRQAAQSVGFDIALYVGVIVVWAVFLINIVFLGQHQLPGFVQLALIISAGVTLGFGLTISHELGHKHFWFKRKLALFNASLGAYGHFLVEHNLGHHQQVATETDSASSRMGESIWRFMPRELWGAWTRAWLTQRRQLQAKGYGVWSWRNEVLQGLSFTTVIYAAICWAFGLKMLPILFGIAFWGAFQLTSANYIEHYGLLRSLKNGKRESCQPHHSWNSNHWISNLILFHLQRHSDHHTYPARPYQALRSYRDVPTLPSGYFAMFVMAYIPPLWFYIMNPLLLREVNRDINRINFFEPKRTALIAQYELG
jgi:alkane 1-monooxygenase